MYQEDQSIVEVLSLSVSRLVSVAQKAKNIGQDPNTSLSYSVKLKFQGNEKCKFHFATGGK